MSLRILLSLLTAFCLTASAQVKVAIFSVNDFHASFVRNDAKGIAGAPALWQTLDSLKRVYPLHVTVSAGDNFGGSFFYNATNGALMPVLFNGLGIRLSAVGNHEFDNGQRSLADKWADCPLRPEGWDISYVCANVRDARTGRIPAFAQPVASVPLTLPGGKQLRVAFVGLITSSTPEQASKRRLTGLSFDGRYGAVLDSVMQLPEASLVEEAQIRVLLTHIGSYMDENGRAQWDDKDAAQLQKLDSPLWHGIISSHTHQRVAGQVNEARYPIVQGKWHGDYIGMLLCTVDTASMQVTKVEPQTIYVSPKQRLEPAPARFQAQIDSLLQHTRTAGGTPIGEVLAKAANPLEHSRSQLYSQTELGTLVCRAYAEAFRQLAGLKDEAVVIGCSHFGTIRAGLPKGEISVLDVGETLPFANKLRAYCLTGEQIRQLVDFGLHNERYGWLQTGNLRITQQENGEVGKLVYVSPQQRQQVLKPKRKYYLVTDDYITTGGDGYDPAFFPEQQAADVDGLPTTTDAFINYLRQLGNL